MKNPFMFGIYQVSKMKFGRSVTLISTNRVKPAGICRTRRDTSIQHPSKADTQEGRGGAEGTLKKGGYWEERGWLQQERSARTGGPGVPREANSPVCQEWRDRQSVSAEPTWWELGAARGSGATRKRFGF